MSGAPTRAPVPLVCPRPATDPFAYGAPRGSGGGERVATVADFLADVAALAARLPERPYLVNLCTDRYRFTVGFGAALCRGQISLLPPQRTPDFLARLAACFSGVYGLIDGGDAGPLDPVGYPGDLAAAARAPAVPAIAAAQVAAIAFTSGTTGEPTPHAKTWAELAGGAVAEAGALGLDRVAGAALVATVPPQHMYGFESSVLLALHNRLAMFGGRPFYPLDVRAALERVPAPRVLVTTPVHLRAIEIDAVRLPPLALVLSATAPLPPEAAARAERRHEAPVYEIFGFTEAGMVAYRRTTAGPDWRLLPGVSIRTAGETRWAEGGHVPAPARFADLIDLVDAKRFVLRGRASDVVNIAGKRASLAGLHAQLLAIPGVVDGAYYLPQDDGHAVPRLAAFVVAPALTRRRLLAELRRRVDPAFLPRPLHIVGELPRNATGKLTLDGLRRLAAERAKR